MGSVQVDSGTAIISDTSDTSDNGHQAAKKRRFGGSGGGSTINYNRADLVGKGDQKHQLLASLEKAKMVDGINKETLAENLVHLARNVNEGRVSFSLTYGLHHMDVTNPHTIVKNWVDANRIASRDMNRPALVSVKFGGEKFKKDYFNDLGLRILDITGKHFKEKLDNLCNDDAVLIEMPTLPNPVFRWVAATSNCPVLAEGANLTSDLLEHGISYLSVLPGGDTPIPFEFGNPLEALKQNSLSFKLTFEGDFNKQYGDLFSDLKEVACAGCYADLHKQISEKIKAGDSDLFRLLGGGGILYGGVRDVKGSQYGLIYDITKFLENLAKKYGNEGKPSGLIHSLFEVIFEPPSSELYAKYIKDSGNADSETTHHFQMIGDALRNPLYNTLINAVYHLGIVKGDIKPVFADKQEEWQKILIAKYDKEQGKFLSARIQWKPGWEFRSRYWIPILSE